MIAHEKRAIGEPGLPIKEPSSARIAGCMLEIAHIPTTQSRNDVMSKTTSNRIGHASLLNSLGDITILTPHSAPIGEAIVLLLKLSPAQRLGHRKLQEFLGGIDLIDNMTKVPGLVPPFTRVDGHTLKP